jgi:hypothetical protein
VRVNLDDRKIDFELADAEEKRKQAKTARAGERGEHRPASKLRRRRKRR